MLGRSVWHLAVAFVLACLWAEGQSRTILVTGASKGIGQYLWLRPRLYIDLPVCPYVHRHSLCLSAVCCSVFHPRTLHSPSFAKIEGMLAHKKTISMHAIGAAISAKFAEAGDRVVLHWRSDEAEAEALRSRLAPSSEGAHICIQADLSQSGAPATLVQQAIRMVGAIDVLVCNHGMHEETPFESTSTLEFSQSLDRIMRVNLHAPAELVCTTQNRHIRIPIVCYQPFSQCCRFCANTLIQILLSPCFCSCLCLLKFPYLRSCVRVYLWTS